MGTHQLVVTLLEVNDRRGCSGLMDILKPTLVWSRYQDTNLVPTSPFADDIGVGISN